jgi:hypothetical protein
LVNKPIAHLFEFPRHRLLQEIQILGRLKQDLGPHLIVHAPRVEGQKVQHFDVIGHIKNP